MLPWSERGLEQDIALSPWAQRRLGRGDDSSGATMTLRGQWWLLGHSEATISSSISMS